MSYTVTIIVPPIPDNDKAARSAIDKLIEKDRTDEGPRPEIFQTFHGELTRKFPCMSSVSEEEIDNTVWSDGPLINNFSCRTAGLGISFSRVEEVLPFLIEKALSLGLVVCDEQTGQIHRPKRARQGWWNRIFGG